jgi:hypothetical protein
MTNRIVIAVVSACLLGIGLLAVGFSGGESSASAKQNFCNSLSDFSNTVTYYDGLDPRTATNAELDARADDIDAAWDDLVGEAADWANADDNALTVAYDDLYYAIQDLPGDNTVAQDLGDLQDELDAFPAAYRATFDGSGCATA